MKRIVHVIIGLNVGGAELMLKRLITGNTDTNSFQHEVVSLTDVGIIGRDLQNYGIKVTALEMMSITSLPITFFKLKKILSKNPPDVVQTWMYHADFLGGLAAKAVGVKKIIWGIRTTDVSAGKSKLTVGLRKICAWLSYSIPTTIICAAEASRKAHEQVGYDSSKMIVIPNGFELDKLQATTQQRMALRRELNILDSEIVIGSVGRFNPVKNQKLFIEVASLLSKKYSYLKFMIVGRDNTAENKELMGWIENQNLADKVLLLGERKDIPVCLKAMDIFCLHSKTEGFPNVLAEAMALGLPCVASDVGDSMFLIDSDIFCIFPNTYNFSLALSNLIENETIRHNFKMKNFKKIKEFSIENCINKYNRVYG